MTNASPLFTAADIDTPQAASAAAEPRHIYTINGGISFVDVLAAQLLNAYEGDEIGLSNLRILLPTRRACTALREAFLRKTDGRAVILPLMSPVFAPDEDELYFLPELDISDMKPPIDPTRRLLLLMPLIKRAFPESLNTQQALSLAQHLASFIDNLYIEDLSLDDLDRLAPDDPKLAINWQKTVTFLKSIIAEFWPDILEATGCMDIGAYRVALIKAYTAYWQAHPPQHPVIVAGTMASVPALSDMLDEILKSPQGYLVVPGLDPHMDDESWGELTEGHPQYLLKQLLDRLSVDRRHVKRLSPRDDGNAAYAAMPPQITAKTQDHRAIIASEMMRPPATLDRWADTLSAARIDDIHAGLNGLSLAEVKNSFQEARLIACIIRDALDTPDHTVMVVTPNRKLAALIQKEMLFWGVELDDSAGLPFAQTGLGRWFLSFIRCRREGFSPVSLLSLLKNGFFRGGADWPEGTDIPQFITRLEKDILRGLRSYHDLATLDALIQDRWAAREALLAGWAALKPTLEALENMGGNGTIPLEQGLRLILQHMEHLATTPRQSGESALWIGDTGEQAASFFASLLETARESGTEMAADEFQEFCQHMLESLSIRPKYGMHPRIRLLGLAEARLQTADTVILAGLNEGSWPTDPGHNPWMSRPMIAEYGFPSPERALSQSAHDFVQGFCCARVFLTRALSADGALTVPSRWISRFKTVLEATDLKEEASAGAQNYIQKALLLPLPQERTAPLSRPAPTLPQDAMIERLSITDAGALQTDPYAFYAKRVLRLSPLDPLDQQPDALLRGQMLHEGLEVFTKSYPHKLPADPMAEMITIGEDIFGRIPQWNADIHAFWWPRYVAMAAWFAEYEAAWRKGDSVIFAEANAEMRLPTARGDVILRGRADRIEKHNDGWVVIDYKTGQPPSANDVQMGYAPQLPLTAAMILHGGFTPLNAHKANMGEAANIVQGLHYWKISGRDSKATTIKPDKKTGQDITAMCEATWEGLHDLLRFYNDEGGAFFSYPLSTQKAAPFSGDYKHLSRVSEWSVADDNHDEQGEAA